MTEVGKLADSCPVLVSRDQTLDARLESSAIGK